MNDDLAREMLQRLTRIEERITASHDRETSLATRLGALEERLRALESGRAWLTGVGMVIAGLAGWFANVFHVTTKPPSH